MSSRSSSTRIRHSHGSVSGSPVCQRTGEPSAGDSHVPGMTVWKRLPSPLPSDSPSSSSARQKESKSRTSPAIRFFRSFLSARARAGIGFCPCPAVLCAEQTAASGKKRRERGLRVVFCVTVLFCDCYRLGILDAFGVDHGLLDGHVVLQLAAVSVGHGFVVGDAVDDVHSVDDLPEGGVLPV